MYDEESYRRGFDALDEEFKRGRYYVVSDPSVSSPVNGVIRLQRGDRRFYETRAGGSSDNLLATNGYHHGRGTAAWGGGARPAGHDGRDERDWPAEGSRLYGRFRSTDGLHAPLDSPPLENRRERQSSYDYYRRNGAARPRGFSRFDSAASSPSSSSSLFFFDDPYRGEHREEAEEEDRHALSRGWDSRAPQWRVRSRGKFNYSSSPGGNSFSSGNNNYSGSGSGGGYRDGGVRQIRVERTDSSGTSNMSTKDYWESRWSSGSSDGQRSRPTGSVSPSKPTEARNGPRRVAGGRHGSLSLNQYLSTDDLPGRRQRLSSRVVYDGARDASRLPGTTTNARLYPSEGTARGEGTPGDKEFLSRVQQELEFQRRNLTGEIDKLLAPMGAELEKARSPSVGSPPLMGGLSSPSFNAEKNTFVDTSGFPPIFKAFVDVSEFHANSVNVSLDQFRNKVTVEARHSENSKNHVATSFTQKIPLPRYADTTSMTAKLNRKGVLKIEVPLLFYFPSENESPKNSLGKSFVYEVKTDSRDGSKVMEIVVKPGSEVSLNDLKVEVTEEGQLTVYSERQSISGGKERRVIKTYSLPEAAILGAIFSKMAPDGTLTVSVPIIGSKG